MLRITVRKTKDALRLKLEGSLAGPWVGLLEETWRREAGPTVQKTILDVSDVTFVDDAGRKLLAEMCRQGVRFQTTGCFMQALLEEIQRECQSAGKKIPRLDLGLADDVQTSSKGSFDKTCHRDARLASLHSRCCQSLRRMREGDRRAHCAELL